MVKLFAILLKSITTPQKIRFRRTTKGNFSLNIIFNVNYNKKFKEVRTYLRIKAYILVFSTK